MSDKENSGTGRRKSKRGTSIGRLEFSLLASSKLEGAMENRLDSPADPAMPAGTSKDKRKAGER